jgi:hypothetical protein
MTSRDREMAAAAERRSRHSRCGGDAMAACELDQEFRGDVCCPCRPATVDCFYVHRRDISRRCQTGGNHCRSIRSGFIVTHVCVDSYKSEKAS